MMEGEGGHPIVLYDGVCGLCNRTIQFVVKHDHADVFRFASLQSALGRRILEKHGASPSDLDTFYVVLDFDVMRSAHIEQKETLLARSDAVSFVLEQLGGVWRGISRLFGLLPR